MCIVYGRVKGGKRTSGVDTPLRNLCRRGGGEAMMLSVLKSLEVALTVLSMFSASLCVVCSSALFSLESQ